ncbi:hypothetical protein [Leuconostoc pseudomesenteroides]|uniref:hypothetical protein n=1 Tax=Leuconostoc pseudomesenteroides TaxID=33968 RepID=UPI0039EB2577
MTLRHPIKSIDKAIADNKPADIRQRALLDLDLLNHPEKYNARNPGQKYKPAQPFSWKPFLLLGIGFGILLILTLLFYLLKLL